MWTKNNRASNDIETSLFSSGAVNLADKLAREVKQGTNYELTDCSSPDSNWRVKGGKVSHSPHQVEGELSQASDRTGKVPQTTLHPTRTETLQIMQLYQG